MTSRNDLMLQSLHEHFHILEQLPLFKLCLTLIAYFFTDLLTACITTKYIVADISHVVPCFHLLCSVIHAAIRGACIYR